MGVKTPRRIEQTENSGPKNRAVSVCSGIHRKGASKTMSNFGTARGEVLACGGKGPGGFWLVAVPQLLEDSENGCCLTFAARRLFPWTVSLLSFPFCFMVCYVLPCSKGC